MSYTISMNKEDIKKLADLSRLELSDNEVELYQKDFQGILSYINTLNQVTLDKNLDLNRGPNTNYLRDDSLSYQPGEFTDDILNQAPGRKDDYFKVQKIL